MFYNLWITRQCNLICKYCYEGLNKENNSFKHQDINQLINFVEKTGKNGVRHWINFHGGEPLLEFNTIMLIIEGFKKRGLEMNYSFTTNGTLFNDYIVKKVKENNIWITVSIDGNKETHNLYRSYKNGTGTYEEVIKNLYRLTSNSILTRIRLTFDSVTVKNLYTNIEHLISIGARTIICVPNYFDNNWDKNTISILEEQILSLNELKKVHKDVYISIIDNNSKKIGLCQGGIKEYNIDFDSNIYPCAYVVGDHKFLIGNIYDGINQKFIKNIQKICMKNNYGCSNCKYKDYCILSRCKYLNYKITGDLLKVKENICMLQKMIIN